MKKSLRVLATVAAFAAQAQTTDTLKKIKDSGSATMGVRESSGALSYTLAGTDALKIIAELNPLETDNDEILLRRLAPFLLAGLTAPLPDLTDVARELEHEPPRARCHRVVDGALDGSVTPPAPARVLGERVLGVVDDEVGAGEERDVAAILGVQR